MLASRRRTDSIHTGRVHSQQWENLILKLNRPRDGLAKFTELLALVSRLRAATSIDSLIAIDHLHRTELRTRVVADAAAGYCRLDLLGECDRSITVQT